MSPPHWPVRLDDFLHFDLARCLGPALLGNAAFQLREMNPLKLLASLKERPQLRGVEVWECRR